MNSSTIFAYEMGRFEPQQDALVSLLAQVMQEPAFNQLRTQEQLGVLEIPCDHFLHSFFFFSDDCL